MESEVEEPTTVTSICTSCD